MTLTKVYMWCENATNYMKDGVYTPQKAANAIARRRPYPRRIEVWVGGSGPITLSGHADHIAVALAALIERAAKAGVVLAVQDIEHDKNNERFFVKRAMIGDVLEDIARTIRRLDDLENVEVNVRLRIKEAHVVVEAALALCQQHKCAASTRNALEETLVIMSPPAVKPGRDWKFAYFVGWKKCAWTATR